jgi:uncharacterized membrane protein
MENSITDVDWGIVARIVHVLAVVVWIGGVWFVTVVVLPAMRKKPSQQWLVEFNAVERRFAPQARVAVLLVLLSGLYMLYQYDLWDRFADARYWWMHLMVGVWLLFAVLLFVLEPLIVHRVIDRRANRASDTTLKLMIRFHRVALALALLAIFAAVGGAHGLF